MISANFRFLNLSVLFLACALFCAAGLQAQTKQEKQAAAKYDAGVQAFKYGNLPEAETNLKQAAQLYEKTKNKTRRELAACYFILGTIKINFGQFAESRPLTEKAAALYALLDGDKSQNVAACYLNVGAAYAAEKQYPTALAHYQKALDIYKTLHTDLYAEVANCFELMGDVYFETDEQDKALDMYQKSLSIEEKYGKPNGRRANLYSSISQIYSKKGQFRLAVENALNALPIVEQLVAADSPDRSRFYLQTAFALLADGRYAEAQQYAQKSADIILKKDGENAPRLIPIYNCLSLSIALNGDVKKGRELMAKAKDIALTSQDPFALALRNGVIMDMGLFYLKLKNGRKSVDYATQARLLEMKEPKPDSVILSASYNNMAMGYTMLEKYDSAEYCHQKGLEYNQRRPQGHPTYGLHYNNRGDNFLQWGKLAEAEKYLTLAYQNRIVSLTEKHPYTAITIYKLGLLALAQDSVDKALTLIQKALSVRLETLNSKHPEVAECYTGMGRVYLKRKLTEQALLYFQKAEHIYLSNGGERQPGLPECYQYMAETYRQAGNEAKAVELEAAAKKIIDALLKE